MDRTINIVQVGVGSWGKNLLRNFYNHPQIKLKAVCDINEKELANVKPALGSI